MGTSSIGNIRTTAPSFVPPANAYQSTLSHRLALIERFALFAGVSTKDCAAIVSAAHEECFARRHTIHIEGDRIRQIVLLTSGCAKVSQLSQNGTEVILRLNSPGEIVGKIANGQTRHWSTAQTLSHSTALVWDSTIFEALSEQLPALRCNTGRAVSEQLEKLQERFREISTERVGVRLSREITRLLPQIGRPVDGKVEIKLSREELAQMIGTTLFTVSRLLSDWDGRGIVSAGRETVTVIDQQALIRLAEPD